MKKLIIILLVIPAMLTAKISNAQSGSLKRNCSNYHVPPPVLHFVGEHPHFAHFINQHPNFIKNPHFVEEHPYFAKLIKNNRGVIQYIAHHYVPCPCKSPQLPTSSLVSAKTLSWPSTPNTPALPDL